MTTCFNGPPILSTSHTYAADGVHDALVVRGSPVRVLLCKGLSLKDAVDDRHAVLMRSIRRQFFWSESGANSGQTMGGEI